MNDPDELEQGGWIAPRFRHLADDDFIVDDDFPDTDLDDHKFSFSLSRGYAEWRFNLDACPVELPEVLLGDGWAWFYHEDEHWQSYIRWCLENGRTWKAKRWDQIMPHYWPNNRKRRKSREETEEKQEQDKGRGASLST